MRQIGLDRFDQRLFLRVIAIPCLLGRYGRELPKSGEGDLAAPVLDSRPPYLLFPQSQFPGMSLKTFRDSGHGASDRSCAYTKAIACHPTGNTGSRR